MYEDLIFEFAKIEAQPLTVFCLLTLILIWCRSILFSNRD